MATVRNNPPANQNGSHFTYPPQFDSNRNPPPPKSSPNQNASYSPGPGVDFAARPASLPKVSQPRRALRLGRKTVGIGSGGSSGGKTDKKKNKNLTIKQASNNSDSVSFIFCFSMVFLLYSWLLEICSAHLKVVHELRQVN